MDCEELPEELMITYNNEPTKVIVQCSMEGTQFLLQLGSEQLVIDLDSDDDGVIHWRENGTITSRAEEIGMLIKNHDD